MQLDPTTLTSLRRVALGSAIVATGLVGGIAAAQDASSTTTTPTTTTSLVVPTTTATTVPEEAPAGPGPLDAMPGEPTTATTAPPFDGDDCPGCGMG